MALENKFDCTRYEVGGYLTIIIRMRRRTTSSQNHGTSKLKPFCNLKDINYTHSQVGFKF